MERSFLKALGLNTEQIDTIFAEYGKERGDYLNKIEEQKKTIDGLKASDEELKKYQKGGEKYIDPTEMETLREFKETTQREQRATSIRSALAEILSRNKVKPGVDKLLIKYLDPNEVEVDDKGKITSAWEKKYIDSLKAENADVFDTAPTGTGIPSAQGFNSRASAAENGTMKKATFSDWGSAIAERNQSI